MLICLLTASCSNDNEPSDFDVTGSWTMTQQSPDDGQSWNSWTLVPTVVVFNADGRFYTDGFFGECNGRWTRKGNVITATASDETQLRFRFESVSSQTAIMRITTLYGAVYAKAVRQ